MERSSWMTKLAAAIISSGGVIPFVAGCGDPAASAAAAQVSEESDAVKKKAGSGVAVHVAGKPVTAEYSANVPPVLLAGEHATLCKVTVGNPFPAIELPKLGGGTAKVADLSGKKATVVLFWAPDRWMAEGALADLANEAAAFGEKGATFVGIIEGTASDQGQKLIDAAGTTLTQLADADGAALAQVGESWLPRVYVLDGQGKIAWFDIEYSEATRRELRQALAELTK